MTAAWYIDAIDARAGMAFASHRRADLAGGEQTLDDPAVLIAPPDFMPRTVASRSVGLGASRRTFQLGLFAGEGEVGFPTLEAVIAFVRRAYVSSGGGDGAAGGGVPPAPPDAPEGPGGEEPDTPGEGGGPFEDAQRHIAGMFRAAEKASAGSRLVSVADFAADRPSAFLAEAGEPEYARSDIGRGAAGLAAQGLLELGAELICRCPDRRAPAAEVDAWWLSIRSLDIAAHRLALWPLAARGPIPRSLPLAARWFVEQRHAFPLDEDLTAEMAVFGLPYSDERLAALGFYLLCLSFPRRDLHWLLQEEDPRYVLRYLDTMPLDEASDRFDDLVRWPLPLAVSQAHGLPRTTSVADFLSLATGSAPSFSGMGSTEHGILLIASAHLAATRSRAWGGRWHGELVEALRRSAFTDAADWLRAQMPETVFPEKVERAILGAATRAYA